MDVGLDEHARDESAGDDTMNDPKVGEVWLADLYGDGDILMFGRVTKRHNDRVWSVWRRVETGVSIRRGNVPCWTPLECCIVQVAAP